MMTHELGHVLGFGHIPAEDGQANMNPNCCIEITTIDENCALFAYSETGGGGGGGGTLPGTVALSTPQDGATDLATTIVFQWQATSDATAYQLQVATDAGFNSVVRSETVAATSQTVSGLDEATTYYWRVRGANAEGEGPWSATRDFSTTEGAPGAVALSSPQDGASIEGEQVTFQWQSLASASSYRLQVGLDPAFDTIAFDEVGLTGTTRTLSPFEVGTTYYWRVRGANASGDGPWSSARSFTTRPALPGMITLDAPDDRADDQPQTVLLRWQADANATAYQVQVSLRANFSDIIVDEAGLTATEQEVGPLATGTTHYWRVRGVNAAGEGPWSPTRRFTTAALPGSVAVDEPADGATVSHTAITFQWQAATDADTYHLQVATDTDFNDLAFEQTGLTGTVRSLTSLQPGTDYVWRVRGINAFGEGDWSTPLSFSTLPAAPAAVALTSPPDGAGATSGIVTLQWQAADRADTYDVQVATDATFGTLEVDESGLASTELEVGPLDYSTTHHWRVRGRNAAGAGPWSSARNFTTAEGTDIERVGEEVPTRLSLHANYPNPFNTRTTVRFDLPDPTDVSLTVYDMLGRIVETLTTGPLPAGRYSYVWEAGDLPSGSYLIQLRTGEQTQTRVAMLIR
ncbi:MAG: T9SS type A sorting domain-containing protein [Bacteroidetes bacterium]|nr:T9SS type A sorting domain-containing protein [Bacteroidota bacterium]